MIDLTINTYCLKEMPIGPALDAIASIGYRSVELVGLSAECHVELTQTSAAELRALHAARGLAIAALYTRPIDVHAPDRLEKSLRDLETAIDLAAELGVTRIVFSPLLPRDDYDYEALAAGCRRLDERITRHAADRASRNAGAVSPASISICLENHHNWPLSIVADYERLLELGIPDSIGFTVDTGHFLASGVDVPAFVRRWPDRIRHVHLKDHVGAASVPLGEGDVDFAGVFAALREIGYSGYASVEIEAHNVPTMLPYVESAFAFGRDELGLNQG